MCYLVLSFSQILFLATVPQWGSIADVGFLAVTGSKIMTSRKHPQRFYNVLDVFDFMMSSNGVITTSVVLVDKAKGVFDDKTSGADQVLREVGKILGKCSQYHGTFVKIMRFMIIVKL